MVTIKVEFTPPHGWDKLTKEEIEALLREQLVGVLEVVDVKLVWVEEHK